MTTTIESFDGGAPPGKVAEDVFSAAETALASCVDALAKGRPSARGKLWIALDIGATGLTSQVRVHTDELGDAAFAACATRAIESAELPATDEGEAVFEVRIDQAAGPPPIFRLKVR